MRTVSAAFAAMQKSGDFRPVRKVELFRRLAAGNGWDATAIDITSEVKDLGRLAWKLDSDALNEWKFSNLAMVVDNSARQWDSAGIRFTGFNLYEAKVRISLGLRLATGDELLQSFTGVIADLPEASAEPTVSLELHSLERVLENADAEKIATLVSNELLGVGDGVKSDFLLSRFPVGWVKEVRVAGVPSRPLIDWALSGTNQLSQAKVSFQNIQPGSGQEVRADYYIWPVSLGLHELVGKVLDTLPYIERQTIETVSLPAFNRRILHTLSADWTNYEKYRVAVKDEPPPPTDDALLTIDPYDAELDWQLAESYSNINFKRLKDGACARWTSQYEGDYLPQQEYQQVEGSSMDPWIQDSAASSQTVLNSVFTSDQSSGVYRVLNLRSGSGADASLSVRTRMERLGGSSSVSFLVRAAGYNAGAVIHFDSLSGVRIRTFNSNSGLISVDTTQWHVYRLDIHGTGYGTGTYNFYIDGVFKASGNLNEVYVLEWGRSYLFHAFRASGDARFQVDFSRMNHAGQFPATGSLTQRVDYSSSLAILVVRGMITTMGPFWAELEGTAGGVRYYFSWWDGMSWSAETEVSNGGNLGSWTTGNVPLAVRLRMQITDTQETNQSGVKRLWLPAIAASPEIDGGDAESWDKLETGQALNNGNLYRWSHVSGIYGDPFIRPVNLPGNLITSDDDYKTAFGVEPRKMRFIFLLNTSGILPPMLNSNLITLRTKSITLLFANVGGRSVLSVIKELAELAAFEFGFTGEGKFFFRSRQPSGSPVLTLDDSNVLSVEDLRPGWDRVYNLVSATFGSYTATISPETEGEANPHSIDRYGARRLQVGGGSLAFQTDADLATVLARRYYSAYKLPKRCVSLTARFMPELELGDKVLYTLARPRQVGQAFEARVLGISHDLMAMKTELELLEA